MNCTAVEREQPAFWSSPMLTCVYVCKKLSQFAKGDASDIVEIARDLARIFDTSSLSPRMDKDEIRWRCFYI
jgi:hypothetical protein